jgi:hypothetical protein
MNTMNIFVDAFNASEWEIMSDGAWVRNRYTNEFILLDRFTKGAHDGIKLVNDNIEHHPIILDRTDTLRSYLAVVGD